MGKVSEFLTRIRNAGMVGHEKVDVSCSKVREGVAVILKNAGFIRDFKVVRDSRQGTMRVYLKYDESGTHAIECIQRVSRPGLRKYIKSTQIPKIRSGYGIAILSTNQGIMTGEDAEKKNIGGEMLCKVW